MSLISIIDYGMGNLRSVAKALEHVAPPGTQVRVTRDPADIGRADRIVLPGQSAIRDAMAQLHRQEMVEPLRRAAREKPFFGMCLGPQALMTHSDENGGIDGLGVLPGRVSRFPEPLRDAAGETLKIPHMGWNQVRIETDHPLWAGIESGERFYFVHSYYLRPDDPALTAATTDYGIRFACAVAEGHVFAVQFHPEKSARNGLALLANFCRWSP